MEIHNKNSFIAVVKQNAMCNERNINDGKSDLIPKPICYFRFYSSCQNKRKLLFKFETRARTVILNRGPQDIGQKIPLFWTWMEIWEKTLSNCCEDLFFSFMIFNENLGKISWNCGEDIFFCF